MVFLFIHIFFKNLMWEGMPTFMKLDITFYVNIGWDDSFELY